MTANRSSMFTRLSPLTSACEGQRLAWAESACTRSEDSSTASKSEPLAALIVARFESFHAGLGTPEMNQLPPLSARMIPYFFIAVMITLASLGSVGEITKLAFSRKRCPIGGRERPREAL